MTLHPQGRREAISALARSSDIPADDIVVYDGSRQSERYTARVSGILSTARIALAIQCFSKVPIFRNQGRGRV